MTEEEKQAMLDTCRRLAASKHYKPRYGCITVSGAVLTGEKAVCSDFLARFRYPSETRRGNPAVWGDSALPDYRYGATLGVLDELIAEAHGAKHISVQYRSATPHHPERWVVIHEEATTTSPVIGIGSTPIEARLDALNRDATPTAGDGGAP